MTLSKSAYQRARRRAMGRIDRAFPDEYRALRDEEVEKESRLMDPRRARDKARIRAQKRLAEQHPDVYRAFLAEETAKEEKS